MGKVDISRIKDALANMKILRNRADNAYKVLQDTLNSECIGYIGTLIHMEEKQTKPQRINWKRHHWHDK